MRELKFKFWLGHTEKMTYAHSLSEVSKIIPEFTKDIIPLQYTGLKDKNGTEIYEGDVDSLYRVVVFRDGAFMFSYPGQTNRADALHPDRCRFIEVIGNIHQHPELIKEKV